MKIVEVTVSEQAEEFYLNFTTGWFKVTGHLLRVAEFRFSAVPINGKIKFSEVGSGARLFETPIPEYLESFEETMDFLQMYAGITVGMMIEEIGEAKLADKIRSMTEKAIELHGPQPERRPVDTDWMKAGESDLLQ